MCICVCTSVCVAFMYICVCICILLHLVCTCVCVAQLLFVIIPLLKCWRRCNECIFVFFQYSIQCYKENKNASSRIRSARLKSGLSWSVLVCPGLPLSVLVCPCLSWSGLACPGLSWSVLVCPGLFDQWKVDRLTAQNVIFDILNPLLSESIAFLGFSDILCLSFASPYDRRHRPFYGNISYEGSGMILGWFIRLQRWFIFFLRDERTIVF